MNNPIKPPIEYCPYCSLPLKGDSHEDPYEAWELYECEYNKTRFTTPPVSEIEVNEKKIQRINKSIADLTRAKARLEARQLEISDHILFRPHRGNLKKSMKELCPIGSKAGLIDKVRTSLSGFEHGFVIDDSTVKVNYYGKDEGTGWDTYVVVLEKYGVVGFTNGQFKKG